MRTPLLFVVGLTLFCACEDPVAEDAGPFDAGSAQDSGAPRDSGFADSGAGDVLLADADPILDATPGDADPTDALPGDALPTDGGPRTGPLTLIFEPDSPYGTTGVAIFHDADGNLLQTRTTTVGRIVETVTEGSMVTITHTLSNPYQLFTITEVAPGETYRVAANTQAPTLAVMAFAIGDPYPGASTYWPNAGCFGGGLTSDPNQLTYLGITADCLSAAGLFDYTVIARDDNLDRLAYWLIEDVPVVANSTVTFVDPWRTDFNRLAIDVSNAPVGAELVYLEGSVRSNGGQYDYDGESLFLSGGAGTYTMVRPPFGEGIDSRYWLLGPGLTSWLQRTAGPAVDQIYDLSVDFLPFPGPVALAASPVVGRPIATWDGIAGLDLVELQALSFAQGVKWTVLLRGDATTFRYPELPIEVAGQAPQDLGSLVTGIRIIDAESVPDYTGARATIGASVLSWHEQFDYRHQPLGAVVRGAGEEIDFK